MKKIKKILDIAIVKNGHPICLYTNLKALTTEIYSVSDSDFPLYEISKFDLREVIIDEDHCLDLFDSTKFTSQIIESFFDGKYNVEDESISVFDFSIKKNIDIKYGIGLRSKNIFNTFKKIVSIDEMIKKTTNASFIDASIDELVQYNSPVSKKILLSSSKTKIYSYSNVVSIEFSNNVVLSLEKINNKISIVH